MNKKQIILANILMILIIPFLIGGCKKAESILVLPSQIEGVMLVKHWEVILPFDYDTLSQDANTTFFNKDLTQFGIDEETFSEQDLQTIKKKNSKPLRVSTGNNYLDYYAFRDETVAINQLSNYYAFTKVYSETEKELILIGDGAHSYKIWINSQLVLQEIGKVRNERVGDRFVRVSLQKGYNTIFAKVSRGGNINNWKLLLGFAEEQNARSLFANNYYRDFIINPIVSNELKLYVGHNTPLKVEIFDPLKELVSVHENMPIELGEINISGLSELKPGFYSCNMVLDTMVMGQTFYKGDYSQLVASLASQVNDKATEALYYEDLKANLERIEHLTDYTFHDTTSISEKTFFDKSRVFWATSLDNLLQNTKAAYSTGNIPGTHLMTYESHGEVKHFMFHASSEVLSQASVPLVMVTPYNLTSETLISDWYLSVLAQIENDAKLADEFQFALVWLFMDGKNYTHEAGYKDAVSVIQRLKSEFKLDENQIFLMGDCEGGRRSLLLASRAPELFAGIGLNCPVTVTYESQDFFNNINRLKEIPIYVTHGSNDSETTVNHSRFLTQEARKAGILVQYVETEAGHYMIDKGYRRGKFEFFRQIGK